MLEKTEEQILRQVERLTALNQILLASSATLDFQTMIEVMLEKIDLLLHYPITSIRLFNHETGTFEPTACRNLDEKEWKNQNVQIGEGIAKLAIESQAPVVIENFQTDGRVRNPEFYSKQGLVAGLKIPLIAKEEILGILSVYSKNAAGFSADELDFLASLGSQAAIALYGFLPGTNYHKPADPARGVGGSPEVIQVISYEIRTRLTSLMGYMGMMRDRILGEINPRQKRALDKVMTHSYELLTLTERLESTKFQDLKEQVLAGSRPLSEAVDEFEREAITGALKRTGFNQTKAASLLGTTRSILRYRMGKLKIKEEPLAAQKKTAFNK